MNEFNSVDYYFLSQMVQLGRVNFDTEVSRWFQLAWKAFGKLHHYLLNRATQRKFFLLCVTRLTIWPRVWISSKMRNGRWRDLCLELGTLGDKIRNEEMRRSTHNWRSKRFVGAGIDTPIYLRNYVIWVPCCAPPRFTNEAPKILPLPPTSYCVGDPKIVWFIYNTTLIKISHLQYAGLYSYQNRKQMVTF